MKEVDQLMKKPLSKEELEDQLCEYCPLEESPKGVHCYGGEPVMCVDTGCCVQAYENYLEEFKEENKEMDNLEKVKEIEEAASKVRSARSRINYLNKVIENSSVYKTEYKIRNIQSEVTILADNDITALILELEEKRLKEAEKKLDNLLNGDVKKLKACLEDIENE
jgi:hypothetical protein